MPELFNYWRSYLLNPKSVKIRKHVTRSIKFKMRVREGEGTWIGICRPHMPTAVYTTLSYNHLPTYSASHCLVVKASGPEGSGFKS